MDEQRISELIQAAMCEPSAPKRLVERTCWKARVAESSFAERGLNAGAQGKAATHERGLGDGKAPTRGM